MEYCTSCNEPNVLFGHKCLTKCLSGLYYDQTTNSCRNCDAECETCITRSDNCLTCDHLEVLG